MTDNINNSEGTISSPVDCAKNSNIDQEIEILTAIDNNDGKLKSVKVLKDPKRFINKTMTNIFRKETDTNDIPLLNRIELYPELPNNIFIPINYKDSINYFINKEGYILSLKKNRAVIKKLSINDDNYSSVSIKILSNYYNKAVHILIANTFLFNPNIDVYNVVNHIDHNTLNSNLNNLNFVTKTENSNRSNGTASKINKVIDYIALSDDGTELFRVNLRNNIHNGISYDIVKIRHSNTNGRWKVQGYYWKPSISLKLKRQEFFKRIGCTGEVNDYNWIQHSIYPEISVCKEGFIKLNKKNIITGFIDSGKKISYVYLSINKIKVRANRVIAEHLIKRKLNKDEIVDHKNRNTLDNSFSNLNITDSKGNANNPNTIKHSTKKTIIVSDLYGNFICCGSVREIATKFEVKGTILRDFIYNNNSGSIFGNYFLVYSDNKANILEKMKKVIYAFDEFYNLVGSSTVMFLNSNFPFYKKEKLNTNKITKEGLFYFSGEAILNKLLQSYNCGNVMKISQKDMDKVDINKINLIKTSPEGHKYFIFDLFGKLLFNGLKSIAPDRFKHIIGKARVQHNSKNNYYSIVNKEYIVIDSFYYPGKEGMKSILTEILLTKIIFISYNESIIYSSISWKDIGSLFNTSSNSVRYLWNKNRLYNNKFSIIKGDKNIINKLKIKETWL